MPVSGWMVVLGLSASLSLLPAPAWVQPARAQTAPSANPASGLLTPATLEELVGPIALYPDDLVSIILPASTQPLQIVEAERFLDQHKKNSSLKPPSDWDPSVVALLNYPDVLSMMNHDLGWTSQLGNAVVAQQADVLNAVQAFRKKVYDAGNLKSNAKQTVAVENQTIVVQSADPEIIYVPQYNPQVVVVPLAVGAPLPYTYSVPYPYYASPAATFATGAIFGTAIGFAIGWTSHSIYSGNWGWGGYYGSRNVAINRTNNINVNVNNTQLTHSERTQFNSRITQNRENAWHPDRNAIARQQASLGTNQAAKVNSAQIRSGLAQSARTAGGNPSPEARQNVQQNRTNRGADSQSHPSGGAIGSRTQGSVAAHRPAQDARRSFNQGGAHTAPRESGGAFSGYQNGATADRFSSRGAAGLRSSSGFTGGGRFERSGGGGLRGRR